MGKPAGKRLTASLEDYLEAVLLLIRQGRVARVRDIAARLGVGMSSVTAALKALAERRLVNYDPYQVVTLTGRGRELAEGINRRHIALRRFLVEVLRLDGDLADANACRMEHAVDDALLDRLVRFGEFVHACPLVSDNWLEKFGDFCRYGRDAEQCGRCILDVADSFGRTATEAELSGQSEAGGER